VSAILHKTEKAVFNSIGLTSSDLPYKLHCSASAYLSFCFNQNISSCTQTSSPPEQCRTIVLVTDPVGLVLLASNYAVVALTF